MSEISICVPLHDPQAIHYDFLQEALESIKAQTLFPKEVLIAGAYKPVYIDKLLHEFQEVFPIRFEMNKSSSTSSNLNFLVPQSAGSIVKILFQDDFFISKTALEMTQYIFEKSNVTWAVCASRNYDDETGKYIREVNPKFRRRLAKGINTIGSPSVVSFKKDCFLPFNKNLVWMLDCEWYLQMQHRFGNPFVFNAFQIANRLHRYQATHKAKHKLNSELAIVNELHSGRKLFDFFSNDIKCICLSEHYE